MSEIIYILLEIAPSRHDFFALSRAYLSCFFLLWMACTEKIFARNFCMQKDGGRCFHMRPPPIANF